MEHKEETEELAEMSQRLLQDGLGPGADGKERERHLWQLVQRSEKNLLCSTQQLQDLSTQQAAEMKEVENYVEHIRSLLEDRESLTAEYEQENEQLRTELHQIRLQQDAQLKEVVEMLEQEGLEEISHSSPSEQVAYLLVERTTLLERLEAAERRLSAGNSLREVRLQEELDHIRQRMEEELRQQRESMNKAGSEELSQQRSAQHRLQRDLDEASRRLDMAHQEIRRLSDELDTLRKMRDIGEPEGHEDNQEVEELRLEVEKLKRTDLAELLKAKQLNERLDLEIRALRDRVRSLDSERKTMMEMVNNTKGGSGRMGLSQHLGQDESWESLKNPPSSVENAEQIHQRYRRELEDKDSRLRELQRRLDKLQQGQDDLVERNEELEALLGETQNLSKAERERHESEAEGLQRKIKRLEAELSKQVAHDYQQRIGDVLKESDVYLQQLKMRSQEHVAVLEGHLTEEKEWRKQLELDLSKAQASLKREKQERQQELQELQTLRQEVQHLKEECLQAKSLSARFVQEKAEKEILQEKVSKLEQDQSRLRDDLEHQTSECARVREDLNESRQQTSQLSSKLCSLEMQRDCVREEQQEGQQSQNGISSYQQEDINANQLASLKLETNYLQSTLEEERLLAGQHQLALQAQISEAQAKAKSQDSLLEQKTEESKQLRQDLQRTQSLFTSAERELRYEREKNLDLKRHNSLLEQEKMTLTAELKQTQARLNQLEQTNMSQAGEQERLQRRIHQLEAQLEQNNQFRHAHESLQGELSADRARLISADKKVLELQQQLKKTLHQLRVEEARVAEACKLERDTTELSDTVGKLKATLHEEQLHRKLVEQREEDLQQHIRSLRVKDASAERNNSEHRQRIQQLHTQLSMMEMEQSRTAEELQLSRREREQLQEQVASSQRQAEQLQDELHNILQQLDTQIRKYNEKQCQHKMKVQKAKQIFMKEIASRDGKIQKLECDLTLACSVSEKERDWIKVVTQENEKLLQEKRELLRRLSEAEETSNCGILTTCTIQQRVNVLEEENKHLQEKTLQLSNQVTSLERALRNARSACNTEELKKRAESFLLSDGLLQTSNQRFSVLETLLNKHAVLSKSSTSANTQHADIGYLNVTSPVAPPTTSVSEES